MVDSVKKIAGNSYADTDKGAARQKLDGLAEENGWSKSTVKSRFGGQTYYYDDLGRVMGHEMDHSTRCYGAGSAFTEYYDGEGAKTGSVEYHNGNRTDGISNYGIKNAYGGDDITAEYDAEGNLIEEDGKEIDLKA